MPGVRRDVSARPTRGSGSGAALLCSLRDLMCIVERRAEVAHAAAQARADGDLGRAQQLEYLLARWDALIALMLHGVTRH